MCGDMPTPGGLLKQAWLGGGHAPPLVGGSRVYCIFSQARQEFECVMNIIVSRISLEFQKYPGVHGDP